MQEHSPWAERKGVGRGSTGQEPGSLGYGAHTLPPQISDKSLTPSKPICLYMSKCNYNIYLIAQWWEANDKIIWENCFRNHTLPMQ